MSILLVPLCLVLHCPGPLPPAACRAPCLAYPAEAHDVGLRIRGTVGDIDPLNKAPLKRARSGVQKGPL